jgi:ABC-type transport system involved in cytochrome c biogenesis permease component
MRWLLEKDLRVLGRSRLLLLLLIVYPVAIALLIGFAISRGPAKPKVAIVNLTPAGQSVRLAGRSLSVQQYANELFSQVDAVQVPTRAAAVRKVSSGSVLAAVVIPPDIVSKISSGVRQAEVEVIYNGDALQQSFVRSSIDSALAEANLALSKGIRDVAVRDIDVLLQGGELGILAAPRDLIGLRHIPRALREIATQQSSPAARRELRRIAAFAGFAASNLGISKDVLATVSQPITVKSDLLHGRRTPLDAFAVVVAVVISLMFVCVLLASGSIALEREEHSLQRLTRGSGRAPALLSLREVIAEKVALSAACAFLLSLAMLCAIGGFVTLQWGRLPLWLIALAAGALAFAALGVAIGALAKEVRAASLLAFLLSLPMALLALVPSGAVAGGLYSVISAISFVFPYKASLQALDAAVNGSSPGLAISVLHVLAVGAVFAALARLGLRQAE